MSTKNFYHLTARQKCHKTEENDNHHNEGWVGWMSLFNVSPHRHSYLKNLSL
jgi:hypothetical protein